MTKKIEIEEVDRLSELLDPILHHILSFLPFRQVVQTCVLSKRWEKIWHSSPDLEFDRTIFDHRLRYCYPSDNTFYTTINVELQRRAKELFSCLVRILPNRQHGEMMISINKFMIDMDLFNDPELRSLLNQCICYAIGCNVKDLKLQLNSLRRLNLPEVVFSSKSIEVLKLKCCKLELSESDDVVLSSLRKLCLKRVYVDDRMIKNLVIGCPLIEDLRLVSCEGFRSLELSGLCKLNVIKLIDNSDLQQVVIKTPNVSLLSIGGPNRPLEIHHSFSKNLKRLSLSSIPVCNKWLHDQIFKLPELEYLKIYDYPLNSLKLSSPSLKTLLILECTYLVEISIITPNLQLFEYQGGATSLSLNALSLKKINLHFCNHILETRFRWYAKYVEFLAKFHDFSGVLSLRSDMDEYMIVTRELRQTLASPLSSSLKHLKLRLDSISIQLTIAKLVDGFLWIAPHTKTVSIEYRYLDIKLSFSYKKQVIYEGKTASCCKSLPISCWQNCIEKVEVEIIEYDDYYRRKNIKMYILKGADIMEQIDALCV